MLRPNRIATGLRETWNYAAFPIRNSFVEQTGHTPCVAGRPFFIVMAWGLLISLLDRHLKQYASMGCLQIDGYHLAILQHKRREPAIPPQGPRGRYPRREDTGLWSSGRSPMPTSSPSTGLARELRRQRRNASQLPGCASRVSGEVPTQSPMPLRPGWYGEILFS